MKKKIVFVVATAALLSSSIANATTTNVSTEKAPNYPSNATPNAPKVNVRPANVKIVPNGPVGTTYTRVYTEPSTITVDIYSLDSTKAEIPGTYQGTKSVDFETYVRDVLPNEWVESWGGSNGAQEALIAGALAVKTYGWYHTLYPKGMGGGDVSNGTSCQVYITGSSSGKTNCNNAVSSASSEVLGDSSGDLWEPAYFANATPGYEMSQNGSYQDAMNGMSAADIIAKWYANEPFRVVGEWQYL